MNTASIFKKMATIVAIVGAGLLAAPLEQAQAQGSGYLPTVFSAGINGCFDDDPNSYGISWDVNIADHWSDGVFIRRYFPSSCLYEGDYVYVKFSRAVWRSTLNRFVPSSTEWVELWVWMGDDSSEPDAYAYDSRGDSYDVDLYIDDYLISGPSWPY